MEPDSGIEYTYRVIINDINPFRGTPISFNHVSSKKSSWTKVTFPFPTFSSRTRYRLWFSFSSLLHASTAAALHSRPKASYPKLANKSTSTPQPGTRAFRLSPSWAMGPPMVPARWTRVSSSAGLGKPRSQGRLSPLSQREAQPSTYLSP